MRPRRSSRRAETATCDECGQELTYCPECDAYHHTDSFEAEHSDSKIARGFRAGNVRGSQTP